MGETKDLLVRITEAVEYLVRKSDWFSERVEKHAPFWGKGVAICPEEIATPLGTKTMKEVCEALEFKEDYDPGGGIQEVMGYNKMLEAKIVVLHKKAELREKVLSEASRKDYIGIFQAIPLGDIERFRYSRGVCIRLIEDQDLEDLRAGCMKRAGRETLLALSIGRRILAHRSKDKIEADRPNINQHCGWMHPDGTLYELPREAAGMDNAEKALFWLELQNAMASEQQPAPCRDCNGTGVVNHGENQHCICHCQKEGND